MTVRILVVDDHPMWRFGIISLLQSQPDMLVIGEAGDGEEAIRLTKQHRPDVVLMDLVMPGMDGVETTRRILEVHPNAAILILTMLDDDSVFETLRAGAKGFQCKVAEGKELLRAIRAVASGEAIFSPGAAKRLLEYFNPNHAPEAAALPELTGREREILALIMRGCKNQEIAEQLSLKPKTIRNRVSVIFSKLQVRTRYEAIAQGRMSGMKL